ncbi:hypothetical protein RJ640_023929 [Escallonia rubra]|uniref:Uncharacterized protein n=1 Tax=Escallonia rubra TaxID=112253 RepID=A0AA88U2L6_9ASTE|nr:hypothetical protein RJ640_023929 [Escallonia rubra]
MIPKSMIKLSNQLYFNVSFNGLSGEIPTNYSFIACLSMSLSNITEHYALLALKLYIRYDPLNLLATNCSTKTSIFH